MRFHLTSTFLFAAMASAQTLVTAPNPPSPSNVDRPFAGGVGHYQQWYAAWTLSGPNGFATPVRMDQIQFLAGLSQSSAATMIDMEVSISHGNFGLTGTFTSNHSDTPLVVWPRQNLQLAAGAPSTVVMTIPFVTEFTWDRTRPIVVDIKIFGNSNNSQPFSYNNLGTLSSFSAVTRLYQAGNANATTGQVQTSIGMVTQFQGRDGMVLSYGTGCPGEGQHVPQNTVVQLPWPGIAWSHQITNAASQRVAIWMIGDSDVTWGSGPQAVSLPADVGSLLNFSPNGCMLRQNAVASLWTMTVGGGAGSGAATVTLNLPPVGFYIGYSLFSQWFVLDPFAPSGLMSATDGAWSIVAPVGG